MLQRLLSSTPLSINLGLLAMRMAAGGLMLLHGIPKLLNFAERRGNFSDPIGLGSTASLTLVVFAEFFCSSMIIAGALTRFALIPLIINMTVIVFIVHGDDSLKEKEIAVFYLLVFLALFFTGPGKYSVDAALKK